MRLSLAFLVDSVPFTQAVRDGKTSLGGSESACLGLARALKARGHDVHIFATRLDDEAVGVDASGVTWHPAEAFGPMNTFIEWDVVIALRQAYFLGQKVNARLRLLWNQDLLVPMAGKMVMSVGWNVDELVYVSEYHKDQWEDVQPELKGYGWATRNGFDPTHVPSGVEKNPNKVIHISRPERGLVPLLEMWPHLKALKPDAELHICRYASMYDGEGTEVKQMVDTFDQHIAAINEQVGGIHFLGGLNKADLYREIASSAVMWYPGVSTFAETSCIASIEAQACGTPFVGSYRGALPETVPSGILVRGDHGSPEYQLASIEAVVGLMDACRDNRVVYRDLVKAGLEHVESYAYDALAEEWEQHLLDTFTKRYHAHKPAILRRLLYDDDHCGAKQVAIELGDVATIEHCDRVMAGKAWTAEDYARTAIHDPEYEIAHSGRFQAVNPLFASCSSVLDIACGNGAFAIGLALASPAIHVHGVDYAADNIARARACAEKLGVADRVTFQRLTVWDFDEQTFHPEVTDITSGHYDGLFVGEFLEHVAACDTLIDGLEAIIQPGATVVYTCPMGPFRDLAPRGEKHSEGHVHCFTHDDLREVFGDKQDIRADFFSLGRSRRGADLGHWMVRYTADPERFARPRDFSRLQRVRPMQRLSVGIIARDAEFDLGRCLMSVWPVADEIVVGDTGSRDDTVAIAEKFGATVLKLAPVDEQPEGFAGARNAVLNACSGEWFLWIDSDEILVESYLLRAYFEGLFNGVVLHQNHVALDAPPSHDVPVRVFRRVPQVQFYGCVHEQPQWGDCNTDISPIIEPKDVQLIHTGYLTHSQREWKRTKRNRSLMLKDGKAFPTRLLSQVIYMREAVVQSDAEAAVAGLTPRVMAGYEHAVRIFITHFDDPGHKYHQIARPWYESAMRALGEGWEMELTMAGKQGGMGKTTGRPERVWVRSHEEYARLVEFKLKGITAKMMGTPPFKTDPDVFLVREGVAA